MNKPVHTLKCPAVAGLFFLLLMAGCGVNRKDTPLNPALIPLKPFSIQLPSPRLTGVVAVEEAILKRRSTRDFAPSSLQLGEIGQLLWAAQGITGEGGKRAAPSAGGLYPLELYVVSWNVDSLPEGVYHYMPRSHSLEQVLNGPVKKDFVAAVSQGTAGEGAAAIVITGVFSRTTWRFREKGQQYVWMEAGHVAQNICLQAVSIGAGTVTMGSFKDTLLRQSLYLPSGHAVLYVMPVGKLK